MSTRSAIIAKIGDRYHGIYCHSDGYIEGVGRTLQKHYTDPAKVEALIGLGDISTLGPEIGEKHDFDKPRPDYEWTRAYHRDRGEPRTRTRKSASWREVADQIGHNGFVYIFTDGRWDVAVGDPDLDEPKPLADALLEAAKSIDLP